MMPSSIVASHVAQPVPARADAVGAGTRTPSKSTSYCVSDAIVICWVSVTPGGRRVDEEQVDVVVAVAGAGEHDAARSAADANGTCHFTPSSTKPSPSAVARELHALRAEAVARARARRW